MYRSTLLSYVCPAALSFDGIGVGCMVADLDLKRKAMESVGDCGNKTYNYKPSKDILEFLKSL